MTYAGESQAQEQPALALNRFSPAPAGDAFFRVPTLESAPHAVPHFGFVLDYAHNPLVLSRRSSNEELGNVVEHQLYLHLGAALGLWDRVLMDVSLPFALAQDGESPEVSGARLNSPSGAQVGDLRLGARLRLLGQPQNGFALGLAGLLWVPTAPDDPGSFVGDGTARGRLLAQAAGDTESVIWAVAVGPDFRADQRYANTGQGTMLHGSAGFAWKLGPRHNVQLGPELDVDFTLEDATERNTNAELILGGKWRFGRSIVAGFGVGPGLTSGIGTPDLRGVMSLAFDPKSAADADRDGITDQDDACPNLRGVKSADAKKNGCPPAYDRDRDGIPDAADSCVEIPGEHNADPKQNGCPPDKDGDGVIDAKDACVAVAGITHADPNKNGCPPDKDGDGVADELDACVDVPGVASSEPLRNGCPPDRDRDGVPDAGDACPDTMGQKSDDPKKNGCPPDADGDGVPDITDACPSDRGMRQDDPKKNGCPAVVVQKNQVVILQQVQFDTDQATIKPVSDGILDEVARVLTEHAELKKLEVQGHTDDRGGRQHNMKLSDARAAAVREALIQRGVDAARLTAKGYGPTRPIAPNTNDAGREKNRRVEFRILEKSEVKP
jgi:outer membrane protein OmpA-like peptidoglycan-associated protein